MLNQLAKWFSPGSTSELRGGLALPRNKPGLNSKTQIKTLELGSSICVPLLNYHNEVQDPVVSLGQCVRTGDTLAHGIIASCHGIIESIEPRAVNHPSLAKSLCVIISPEINTAAEIAVYPTQDTVTEDRIEMCAIRGLGGAGFNTANKLHAISGSSQGSVDTLIINAVECEPLISCDEALITSQAPDIVKAIEGLIDMTRCRRCLLAIENDKPTAIEQLELAVRNHPCKVRFEIVFLSPIYPSGAERPLVERLTGKKIPDNVFPADLGILCINIATALATEYARQGKPMVSRIVTIAGELAHEAINVRVTFGTSVYDVLQQTGNLVHIDNARVRLGGPLSGFLIEDLSTPVTATTNCITLERSHRQEHIHSCIRCGACSDVCPVDLLPQQLNTYCLSENTEKAKAFRLSECIECACCDIVCPSNIPLTQTFRFAKGLMREQDRLSRLASQAEGRYKQRELRLTDREEKRAIKRKAALSRLTSSKDPIADALARAKQRRQRSKDD